MPAHCAESPKPIPLFFVENNFGKLGREFVDLDRDRNSRAEIVRLIRNGSLSPVKILQVIEPCDEFPRGDVVDVTDELVAEAEQARDPDPIETSLERLRGMLIDHERDLMRDGLYGWPR